MGHVDSARKTAAKLHRNSDKSNYLTDLATAQGKAGDKAGAMESVNSAKPLVAIIDQDVLRSYACSRIAAAQSAAGDGAATWVRLFKEATVRARGLCGVVAGMPATKQNGKP
jgi:hypothetical protein